MFWLRTPFSAYPAEAFCTIEPPLLGSSSKATIDLLLNVATSLYAITYVVHVLTHTVSTTIDHTRTSNQHVQFQ